MATTQQKTRQKQEEDLPDVIPVGDGELAVIDAEELAATEEAVAALKAQKGELLQGFVNWLVERASGTDADTYETMESILRDILEGADAEEVLRERSTVRAHDLVNKPLILHSYEIREGDYEESMFQHYAAMTVGRVGFDGTRVVCCGATKVLMKLYALDRFDPLPLTVMFTEKDGKKGPIIDLVQPAL